MNERLHDIIPNRMLLDVSSTGTILEKDAYFPSLMDRHTDILQND